MAYDFEPDADYQKELDWVDQFVREELEPLDFLIKHPYDRSDPVRERLIPPLQQKVRVQSQKGRREFLGVLREGSRVEVTL